jgi:hypothetical protein
MDYKSVCRRLSEIRSTGSGDFYLGDATVKVAFRWVFQSGRLVEVSSHEPSGEQVKFLEQTYGPPVQTKMAAYQNGYGARWECPLVIWLMADGAIIRAEETIQLGDRWMTVTFRTRERAEAVNRENQEPNPYAAPGR